METLLWSCHVSRYIIGGRGLFSAKVTSTAISKAISARSIRTSSLSWSGKNPRRIVTRSNHLKRVSSARSNPTGTRQYSVPASEEVVPNFAFAFDIDGVLLRSSELLPGASAALQYLHKHAIPFILLTNGGGKLESVRVKGLSEKLNVPLTVDNFVQSHTPFKEMVKGSDTAEALENKTILVTGSDSDKAREIAEAYGFKNVITPADIIHAYPGIWPFNEIFTNYYTSTARPLPLPLHTSTHPPSPNASGTPTLKIDAIFIFNDPRDWGLDSQLILDLLMSHRGHLGTLSPLNGAPNLPNHGWQQDEQPLLVFSNPDLWWAAGWHLNRLGQGGFRVALEGLWREITGGAELERTVIGKPYGLTYKFAEEVLLRYRAKLLRREGVDVEWPELKRVFMVGDNPASDIKGANDFVSERGTEWVSVLVRSGVFVEGRKPAFKPKMVVDGVLDAVMWALEKEGWKGVKL